MHTINMYNSKLKHKCLYAINNNCMFNVLFLGGGSPLLVNIIQYNSLGECKIDQKVTFGCCVTDNCLC